MLRTIPCPRNCQYRCSSIHLIYPECEHEFRYSIGLGARMAASARRKLVASRAEYEDRSCSLEKYTVYGSEEDFSARQCVREIESVSSSPRALKGVDTATFPLAKLVTEKCDKARNLVKLSAGLGRASKPAHSVGAPGVRVFKSWENIRDIPAGKKRADNTFSKSSCHRCRCNFKGICLSRRIAATLDNVRDHHSWFAIKISRQARPVAATSAHTSRFDTLWNSAHFFLRQDFTGRRNALLKQEDAKRTSYCFLFLLWSDIGMHGSKSWRWKSYYGES